MPSRQNVHTDQRLTNYATGYAADIATWVNEAFPVVSVQDQSDKYAVYGAEEFAVRDLRIGPKETTWPQVDWEESEDTYFCQGYGAEHIVADAQDPDLRNREERRGARLIAAELIRDEAYKLASMASDASEFTNAGSAVDLTSDDPRDYYLGEADTLAQRIGTFPDSLMIGFDVAKAILGNSNCTDVIKYTYNAVAEDVVRLVNDLPKLRSLLADYLGVERVVVPLTLYNSASEGATVSLARMWPTETSLLYYRGGAVGSDDAGRPLVEMGMPTALTRFFWTGKPKSRAGFTAWKIRDELVGEGAARLRASMWYDYKVTWDNAGTLASSVLS